MVKMMVDLHPVYRVLVGIIVGTVAGFTMLKVKEKWIDGEGNDK